MRSTKNGQKTSNAPIVETGTKVEVIETPKVEEPKAEIPVAEEPIIEIPVVEEIPVIEDTEIEDKKSILKMITNFITELVKLLFGE